jgi:hypothetical protein
MEMKRSTDCLPDELVRRTRPGLFSTLAQLVAVCSPSVALLNVYRHGGGLTFSEWRSYVKVSRHEQSHIHPAIR